MRLNHRRAARATFFIAGGRRQEGKLGRQRGALGGAHPGTGQERDVTPLAFAPLALAPGPRRRHQGIAFRPRQLAGGDQQRPPPVGVDPVESVTIAGELAQEGDACVYPVGLEVMRRAAVHAY